MSTSRIGLRLVFPSLVLAGGFVAKQFIDGYMRVYYTVKFLDKSNGVKFDDPSVDQALMKYAGWSTAITIGSGTFLLMKNLMYSILLSSNPNTGRLFDKLKSSERPAALNPRYIWRQLAPHLITEKSLRLFYKAHGVQALCILAALGWTAFLTPIVHAKTESFFATHGDAQIFGRERRERETRIFLEATAIRDANDPERLKLLEAAQSTAVKNAAKRLQEAEQRILSTMDQDGDARANNVANEPGDVHPPGLLTSIFSNSPLSAEEIEELKRSK